MMYKALRSFSGIVSMHTNEIKDIEDEVVAKDLVEAGYVVKVEIPEKIDLSGQPIENEEKEEVDEVVEPLIKKSTSKKKK